MKTKNSHNYDAHQHACFANPYVITRVDGGPTPHDYEPLKVVLCAAFTQAAGGKGVERHAAGDPFVDQPIMSIGRLLQSADGEVYQAIKKAREALQMSGRGQHDAAIRELLGAINYLAATALLVSEASEVPAVDAAVDTAVEEEVPAMSLMPYPPKARPPLGG